MRRLLRGNRADPPWVRPALLGLLGVTGVLYLYGLSASGWANPYYSAAAQAGAADWTAFFFGATDPAHVLTIDKPPLSVWVMALSVRLFGLDPWSILGPQALAGVAAVGVLYAAVRRWYGPVAGLLAGAIFATTPVATLMFRYNNPDALLTLLLVVGAYAIVRATESASTGWLVVTGAVVGAAFLTKMLQALLVVPAFAGTYLLAAPARPARRIRQLLVAGAVTVAVGGWYVSIVELIPPQRRPYVGGSRHNSIVELTLGYNGLGRLTGTDAAGAPGLGDTEWTRLFGVMGTQIAWLLPAALILLVACAAITWREPRERAGVALWGGWLVVTGIVFSTMGGTIHSYYAVALAPAIAALVGIGVVLLWRRGTLAAHLTLALVLADTALWSTKLLGHQAFWQPWLRPAVLTAGLGAAALLVAASWWPHGRRLTTIALSIGLVAGLAAPTAYSLNTAATPHEGAVPIAGPAERPRDATASPGEALVARLRAHATRYTWAAAAIGASPAARYQLASGYPVLAVGGFTGTDPVPTLDQFQQYVRQGRIHYLLLDPRRAASGIADWVIASFPSSTVDGVVVYDLSVPTPPAR